MIITVHDEQSKLIWETQGENCHSLALSPDNTLIAFQCELNGLMLFRKNFTGNYKLLFESSKEEPKYSELKVKVTKDAFGGNVKNYVQIEGDPNDPKVWEAIKENIK